MKTIKDLKEYLQDVIEALNDYEDDDLLEVVYNTYFLKSNRFICDGSGFVSLDYPTGNDNEEEDF